MHQNAIHAREAALKKHEWVGFHDDSRVKLLYGPEGAKVWLALRQIRGSTSPSWRRRQREPEGDLPAFATLTHAKTSDLEAARTLNLPRHSIVVCDRGYIDYAWFHSLTKRRLFFVTRALKDMDAQAIERHAVPKASGVTLDETIQLNGKKPRALGKGQ